MKPSTKQIGNKGESAVAESLVERGYEILGRNYFSRYGEIDIVAQKGEIIAFVEVKTRKKNSHVDPLWTVTKSKQVKIIKTAFVFIEKNNVDLQPRFDVAIITNLQNDTVDLEYYENAFDGDVLKC